MTICSEFSSNTLDLSSFDTSNVTLCMYVRLVLKQLHLDLSSFDTSNVHYVWYVRLVLKQLH